MAHFQNLSSLFNYDNEIGTPQKPPKLLNVNDYSNWKARFEEYISYTDSSLWIPILEGYKHPTYIFLEETVPKPISKLDEEEKKVYDREKKADRSITMALSRDLFHSFKGYDNSKDLRKAIQKRFEGNSDVKKSKRELLRKQYECFSPQEEEHALGGGNHTGFIASGSSQHHQPSSRNTTSTSSANQTAIAKIAEDHVALFSSYDMEVMDIQWNIDMILRRAKPFLDRTGRKFIGGHSNAKVGFDKSKAKCYKCQNFGHFATKCQKDKAPASGFIGPSQGSSSGNNQGFNNQNNRNQSQGETSTALVVQ
ncbi:hypothetical protein L1987_64710 [Smallanthus sonchifolius]|uniref:Uncharacterized protein n=1 Tax=Smallanthus sonchifolius TaxID=185202 RepID=A0ACB9BSG4_9ASTR|nr:hypothetical protein L1987_64710 [Smallanthus sonchifolius]